MDGLVRANSSHNRKVAKWAQVLPQSNQIRPRYLALPRAVPEILINKLFRGAFVFSLDICARLNR